MRQLLIIASLCLLVACGSGGSQSKPSTPTNNSTSSNASLNSADITFIYPAQKSHLGGVSNTHLVVSVKQAEQSQALSQLQIGDVVLQPEGNFWRTNTPLNLDNTNNQIFPITAQLSQTGEQVVLGNLTLNNGAFNTAGNQNVFAVTGLAVDDDGAIYLSNPYDAQVYKYEGQSADVNIIYQGTASDLSQTPYWAMAIDSANNTLYVSTDTYVGDEFAADLVMITPNQTTVIADENKTLTSSRGLFLDLNSQMALSSLNAESPIPSIYTLDFESQSTLQRWFLSPQGSRVVAPNVFAANGDSSLSPQLGILSLTGKLSAQGSTLLIAREFETDESRGDASLIEITSSATPFDASGIATELTKLEGITKPAALTYNREGTHVFIADNDKIWLMNMQDYSKQLVTSSIFIDKKGDGSRIGNNVTALASHPTLDYLYVAAGTNGLIMVDLTTGNRITLVK